MKSKPHCLHECVCTGYANRSEMIADEACKKEKCTHRISEKIKHVPSVARNKEGDLTLTFNYDALTEHDNAIRVDTLKKIEEDIRIVGMEPLAEAVVLQVIDCRKKRYVK